MGSFFVVNKGCCRLELVNYFDLKKTDRILAYSLLAHVYNSSTLMTDLLDVFVPIVKRAISILNREGQFSGKNISEIEAIVSQLYDIEIPLPVLKKILLKIAKEVNTEDVIHFQLYQDGSFAINNYVFAQFDDFIEKKAFEIQELERIFIQFCKLNNITREEYGSIFTFIELNKLTLGKYLKGSVKTNNHDYTIEARFVEYFKSIATVYELIRNIYLGSIISSYIEYEPEKIKVEVELVFDTNYIISLIDLNTPESTKTCSKLLDVAKSLGFKTNVLIDTIEEASNLLHKKAENFDKTFLQKKVNPEDIYNACDRRKLSKVDIDRIADNLEDTLSSKGIIVIPDTTKYRNLGKFSDEYIALKKIRYNDIAALHDATAIQYVKSKRGDKKIKDFEKVNCWFVNNSISDNYQSVDYAKGKDSLPITIKVDDLLNILWLSNPNVSMNIHNSELVDIGITTLISCTLNENLPKASIIKELDDNIQKYAKDNLTDKDVYRVATRIANKRVNNIEQLNLLAQKDSEEFVRRLETMSLAQKEEEEEEKKKMDELLKGLVKKIDNLDRVKSSHERQSKEAQDKLQEMSKEIEEQKQKRLIEKNKIRKELREEWVKTEVKKWRSKSWRELFFCILVIVLIVLCIFYNCQWNVSKFISKLDELSNNIILKWTVPIIITIVIFLVVRNLINKYRNQSNVKAFKDMLQIPDNLKHLDKLDD